MRPLRQYHPARPRPRVISYHRSPAISGGCRCSACAISGEPFGDEPQWESGRPDPTLRSAMRFASAIRKSGFMPRPHFIERLAERVLAKGGGFDPKTFAADFQQGKHYRQTREGYAMRVAVVDGIPILYRMGGPRGRHVVLGGLLPEGALPPSEPIRPPQREMTEGEASFIDPEKLWSPVVERW